MARVIKRTPDSLGIYEYRISVHTPDYPSGTWLIDPNLTGVSGVDQKYWKVSGDSVVEMSQGEKDAVDAAIAAQEQDALEDQIVSNVAVLKPAAISSEIQALLKNNPIWTDSVTGLKGPPPFMLGLHNEREILNPSTNPLYVPTFKSLNQRIADLETVHSGNRINWHQRQILEASYRGPGRLIVYYGWPNSFNSGVNGWNNEKVAVDLARYNMVVLGSGVADPSHGDYSNTSVIVPRIQALNPRCLIFGYVDTTLAQGTFEGQVDDWETLGVSGIMMDKAGYDYGTTRTQFNTRVEYVHEADLLVIANAWNMDHIIGTTNDPSYPNTTYNSGEVASSLVDSDYYLLESFPINTQIASSSTLERGAHNGSNNSATLSVSGASWSTDEHVGKYVYNMTDGSYGVITGNTSTTVTASLSGGTDNDWDTWDLYAIRSNFTDGYEVAWEWSARASKAITHRGTYGIGLVGLGIIGDANDLGEQLFAFHWMSALMLSLDCAGISDDYYGASSAKGKWWAAPDFHELHEISLFNPSVQVSLLDNDIYTRQLGGTQLSLDFTPGKESWNCDRYFDDRSDPSQYWEFRDHFTGQYLNNIWLPQNSGTNSTIVKKTGSPCAQTLRAGDSAGDYATLSNSYQTIDASMKPHLKVGFQLVHTSDISAYIGLWDSNNDRVEFKADTSSGYWLTRTYSGGSSTVTQTTVALDTDWHRFEIICNPDRVVFKIDGSIVSSHFSNITAEEMYARAQVANDSGTAVREGNIDYFYGIGKVPY